MVWISLKLNFCSNVLEIYMYHVIIIDYRIIFTCILRKKPVGCGDVSWTSHPPVIFIPPMMGVGQAGYDSPLCMENLCGVIKKHLPHRTFSWILVLKLKLI